MGSEEVILLCKGCKKSTVYVGHSNSYCEHCFVLRKKANLKYKASHKQEEQQRTKAWLKKNPNKVKEYSKRNYAKNGHKHKEANKKFKQGLAYKLGQKKYREINKASLNLRSRIWQRDNKERVKENKNNWLKLNPNKPIEYVHARHSREQKAIGIFTAQEWERVQNQYGNICLWCESKPERLSADHVIPLSRGGTNLIENIQPLCAKCNSKKNTRILDFRPFGNIIMDWT